MKKTFMIAGQIFTADIHKEGKDYVANCVEVPVSDFGSSQESALKNIAETTKEHLKAFPKNNTERVLNRKYIIRPIDEIIDFYPELIKSNHIGIKIILITTNTYKYDFGKLPHVLLNFKDVFRGDDGFIAEEHLKILKEIISNLGNITLVVVGCDAGLSRSPAVAAAIARCAGDEAVARKILDAYQFLNTDVFDMIVDYVK